MIKKRNVFYDIVLNHPTEDMTLTMSLSQDDFNKWSPYLIRFEAILLSEAYKGAFHEQSGKTSVKETRG
jgi:hypothetical protein